MPVFTPTPTSLRVRRAMPRLNSATPATTPVVSADNTNNKTNNTTSPPASATANAQANATIPTPSSPFLEPESFIQKAKRAYDRDRQRVLRRKQRAERERERNASSSSAEGDCRQCSGTGTTATTVTNGGNGRRASGGRSGGGAKPSLCLSEDDDDDDFPVSPQVEEIIADVVQRQAQAKGGALDRPVEVHLGELIKPGKARKSKGECEHPNPHAVLGHPGLR